MLKVLAASRGEVRLWTVNPNCWKEETATACYTTNVFCSKLCSKWKWLSDVNPLFSCMSHYKIAMTYFNRNTWLAKDLFTVIWQHETFFLARTGWWRLLTLVCCATLRAMYMKWNTQKNRQSNGQLPRHYTAAYTLLGVMCKLVWKVKSAFDSSGPSGRCLSRFL